MLQTIARPCKTLDRATRRERESRFLKRLFDEQSKHWGAYHALNRAQDKVRYAIVRQSIAEQILHDETMRVAGEIDRLRAVIRHRMGV
jgi:hypothetical protein